MRQQGIALREIERDLGIPKSTLSWWFRGIKLTQKQNLILKQNADRGLIKARKEAVKWHNAQKRSRLQTAAQEAADTLKKIDSSDHFLELALAFLYLGEGMKKNSTAMGNSNPAILRFFVRAIESLYDVPANKMKCELHLRADQDPHTLVAYWSMELGIPVANFGKSSVDKRTAGRPTYPSYKGVCIVRCPSVAIQRKLLYIASEFCNRPHKRAVSSSGRAQH